MTTHQSTPATPSTGERAELVESLQRHRGFLRQTVDGITDEQAQARPTVSELTLGGLIKHVSQTEQDWVTFILEGPAQGPDIDWEAVDWTNPSPEVVAFTESHRMVEGETLAGLLTAYEQVAARTDELVASLPDLDASQPLPEAPWFEAGSTWSARRTFLHIIAETSQHAGHADIIREALDGQKTMG